MWEDENIRNKMIDKQKAMQNAIDLLNDWKFNEAEVLVPSQVAKEIMQLGMDIGEEKVKNRVEMYFVKCLYNKKVPKIDGVRLEYNHQDDSQEENLGMGDNNSPNSLDLKKEETK